MEETRFRIVVLGPGKVGKTSIIRRYLHGTFDEKYRETVEDLYSRDFNIQMSDIWSQIVQQRKDARTLPTVVVGNKCDSSPQKVYEATVQAWMQHLNFNISYVESSAKMNYNTVKIFRNFLDQSGLLDEEKWMKQQKLRSREISPTKKLNRNWSLRVSKAKDNPKGLNRSGSLYDAPSTSH